ncbi:voltage-dependent calcium channel subunit alpha-2/delta-2a isoform X1 [Tachysurus ichikawai]
MEISGVRVPGERLKNGVPSRFSKESAIEYYDSKAESDYSDYNYEDNQSDKLKSISLEFVDDPNFKNKVNYSYTAVQIPTDIYKGCE